MVNSDDLISKLQPRATSWTEVARTLTELESNSALDQEGRPWARVVAARSGYSVNQLRKMQRGVKSLEELAERKPFDVSRFLEIVPFSHAELLSRILRADEERGLELIHTGLKANRLPTYRDLLEQFNEVRDNAPEISSVAAAQRAARMFETLCFDLLTKTNAALLPGFSGEKVRVVRWSGGLRFASPDLVIAFRDESGAIVVDAVDCYAIYGDVAQDETAKRMTRVATESTFFRNFWILMPPWSAAWLVRSMCDQLDLANVGVIVIDPETKNCLQERAPLGEPVPNRQSKAADDFKRILRKL